MYSKTSVRSSAFSGQERRWMSSFFSVAKKLAAAHRLGDPGGAGLLAEREANEPAALV